MTVRPATPADLPAIAALYRRIAQEGNGMIDRRPPLYDMTAPTWPENFDGVTPPPAVVVRLTGTSAGSAVWAGRPAPG